MKQQPKKKDTAEDVEKPLEQKAPKQKRNIEISPESQEDRRLLSAFLLDKKEELIQERNRRRKKFEEEKIELSSGKFISRIEIKQLITSLWQNYPSAFPNDNDFFKHMFRLHPKLMGLDYKQYRKPRLAGKLLKQLIYDLFEVEVLPALVVFAMADGKWITKCYKHLTPVGHDLLIKYRDQANRLMEKFQDGQWYDFYKEFCATYKRQPWLF